ncbi:MAG: PA14 domain-containing protein [Anaerolineae bacterium]
MPDQLIVKLKPGVIVDAGKATTSSNSLNALLRTLQVNTLEPLSTPANQQMSKEESELSRYYLVHVAKDSDIPALVNTLAQNPEVELAIPNRWLTIDRTPNDPLFSNQWALNGSRQANLHIREAWDMTTGSSDVIVAVLDTGLDLTYSPEIGNKDTYTGYDFINNDQGLQDDQGHGTAVSGIIAARGDDGIGVAGISWGAMIMPVKVCDSGGHCSTAAIWKGIEWAARHGARIANMSFSGPASRDEQTAYQQWVDFAYQQGVVMIASAGNDRQYLSPNDTTYNLPAELNHVIVVGATNDRDEDCTPNFTNVAVNCGWDAGLLGLLGGSKGTGYGPLLDVMAPGSANIWTTKLGGGYRPNFAGTSAAAPFVSGLAALVLSVNPGLSPDRVETLIKQNAQALDPYAEGYPNESFGWGRIDAERTVRAARSVTCPGQYRAEYFNNKNLAGDPVFVQCENAPINHDWGYRGPDYGVGPDNFSVRWTGRFSFNAATYIFNARADDGVRAYIDGVTLLNEWRPQAPTSFAQPKAMTAGEHEVRVEYYEEGGGATAQFNWQQDPTTVTCPSGQYKTEYYNNKMLSGSPVFTRCESAPINYDWGGGGPGNGVGSDNFSVRWTGRFSFNAATYIFNARADDGVRAYIDGVTLLNEWRPQAPTSFAQPKAMTAGEHEVRVEYYEEGGGATAQFNWQQGATPVTCSGEQYKAEYYNNKDLAGTPVFVQCENWPINHDWGNGGPGNGVGADNFSVRWTGRAHVADGNYTFIARSDDGIRVWMNQTQIINAWYDQGAQDHTFSDHVADGVYEFKIEYYENAGAASARFRWEQSASASCPSGQYKAEYYNNKTLSGTPILTRCESAPINYDWVGGGPGNGVNNNSFSVRWTGRFSFDTATYDFTAQTDDGMRVYIDGGELLNEWRAQVETYVRSRPMTAGEHEVKVEYYEDDGWATAKFSWQQGSSVDPMCRGIVPPDYGVTYYNNVFLSGNPTYTTCGNWPIHVDWGAGGPGHGVGNDYFSVRYQGTAYLEAGTYTFTARGDDGFRVWIDDTQIMNEWRDQAPFTKAVNHSVSGGYHDITIEYYEKAGGALFEFDWARADRYVRVVEALHLSSTNPQPNQTVTARFKVRNTGTQRITIQGLAAGARRGTDWSGEQVDFPHVSLSLDPNQEYLYEQQRSFSSPGSYFAEPVLNLDGNWGGIDGATRVSFTVGSASSCQGAALGFEQTVSGSMSNSSPTQNYCFTGASGTWASIRMFAIDGSSLDTIVALYRPDGSLLSRDDDGADVGHNSFLVAQLDQTGVWRVEATRWGSTSGPYRLRMERGREAALGDLDRNCVVNEADRQQIVPYLGTRPGDSFDANWNRDLNLDSIVDAQDHSLLVARMNRSCSSAVMEQDKAESIDSSTDDTSR